MDVQISVIIATCNRYESLKDTIDSLLCQQLNSNLSYEVIVVDNNSSDKTRETVQIYQKKEGDKLRYLFELRQGKSYALNSGIKEAKGEIVAFTDDDVVVDKKWLLSILECFKNLNCDGIGGRILPLHSENIPDWVKKNKYLENGPFVYRDRGKDTKIYDKSSIAPFIGANAAYKKECFTKFGLYREDLGPGSGLLNEDTEFFRRLVKNDAKLYYCGKALAWHKTDKKRMNYKYVAKWYFIVGRSSIQENNKEILNEKYICYCDIPRTFIRNSITRLILFIINIFNSRNAIKHWTMLFWSLGQCYQYRLLMKRHIKQYNRRMKVAFVVDAFPAISETFIINQIIGLIDLGHIVEIYAHFNPNQPKIHPSVFKYRLLEKTFYSSDIVPVNKIKRIIIALGRTVKNFHKNPIAIIKSLNFFKFGKNALGLRDLLYTTYLLDKDIIHCHFGTAANNLLFIKELLDIPYLTSFHGFDVNSYVKENGKGVYSELFRRGNLFTYNSEATKKRLKSLSCPAALMRKMPMGIKLDRFKFKERHIKPDGQIKILSVGRLVEFKGREYAIKAVASILNEFPGINYKIVGNGPLRKNLEALIKTLGAQENIQILDWSVDEELINLYEESHIFLHPSVTADNGDMEGQGVVLLEALACGLGVIATNHNAIPETIIDAKTGLLVPEKDVKALAEKITYLIKNQGVLLVLAKAGRKLVEERFDIDKLNKELADIYIEVVN